MSRSTRVNLISLALALAVIAAQSQLTRAQSTEPSTAAPPGAVCDLMTITPQPRAAWQMDAAFVQGLTRSAECFASNDLICSEAALAAIAADASSDDEKAMLAVQNGRVATARRTYAAAADHYIDALKLPAIEPSLRRLVVQELAAALLNQNDPAGALNALHDTFDCHNWTADALALRGAAYLRINAAVPALESLKAAIRLYGLDNRPVPAGLQERHDSLARQTGAVDRDVVPLVRVGPEYPSRALRRNQCGSVQIQFDISENGNVENARAVDSTDPIFEPPAIAAISQWRYAPKLENGSPVRREGVQTILRFDLYEVKSKSCEALREATRRN